ncbi:alpha-N-arabinofuranosidase C [Podospora aff. communis PSN243]|uniref:non-reducing end alpha-L-arabinofuranosidase n=1 Tax=Podospora aff. communis PSN243 TaxID=3040156 RepID=A0AAV9GDI1_9PEZI|nr:alpha-N-arabinofuranosidase C [Podospora aff. communis PSN243]
MTTFTKIPEDERPTITVDARNVISPISDYTYGGFTEHMGRCIYGGIYDPGNPVSDENGFRKDVIEAMQDLKVPVVRYPGGNFVATYHWMDGIGPRDKRPKRPELAWLGVESNQFGTDEFMKWCKIVGTEPYICLNFGTGTLDEAMAWLEYCNGTQDTYYANLRRSNGHPEPYNVKFWALGNEVYGSWQVCQTTPEAYAHKAYQWAKALKLLDPSIELILCGESGFSSWDSYVTHKCFTSANLISMHSIHLYTSSDVHLQNVTAPLAAERAIQMAVGMIDLARIENGVPPSVPRPKICFDEWNVWDMFRSPGDKGAEEKYTLSDALAVAVWLNVFVRQAKHVGMANIAQSVNVISPLMTTQTGVVKQTTWWPVWLFSRYMRGETVGVNLRCGEWEGETKPGWIRGTVETPWLDVSAAKGGDGVVSLAVVNLSEGRDWEVEVEGVKGEVEVFEVGGREVGVTNVEGREEVGVREGRWDGKGGYTFPRHSLTMLRWRA